MQTTTRITTIENLPKAISAETRVMIPGHYIEMGDKMDRWLLRRESDHKPVRVVRVIW